MLNTSDAAFNQLDFIHGLYESAIYGGRVDNVYDLKVLAAYLRQYFNKATLSSNSAGKRVATPNISLASSTNIQV